MCQLFTGLIFFSLGYVIPGGGVLVLGEEQDEPGSRFDSSQSF